VCASPAERQDGKKESGLDQQRQRNAGQPSTSTRPALVERRDLPVQPSGSVVSGRARGVEHATSSTATDAARAL
jgi:hypothetical protein